VNNKVLVVQDNQTLEPVVMHGDASIAEDGTVTVSGGGGSSITGLTDGFVPLANGATSLNRDSAIDDGVTNANAVTCSKTMVLTPVAPAGDELFSIGTGEVTTPTVNLDIMYLFDFPPGGGQSTNVIGLSIDLGGGGTSNTALDIDSDLPAGANNRAINSRSTAKSDFAGPVAIPYLQAHTVFTVATLPAAATAGVGARAFVSDANASTFNTVAAGGGANKVPVFCDGAAWRIG
jgi:hypothetical protein